MNLPGWTCRSCGVLNGEEKERLFVCRACGSIRPPELDQLERALQRKDMTAGERALLADMQRAIDIHGITLTPGQAATVRHILERPERVEAKTVPPKRRWRPPMPVVRWSFWDWFGQPIVGLVLAILTFLGFVLHFLRR
jgi:hypothetical protein